MTDRTIQPLQQQPVTQVTNKDSPSKSSLKVIPVNTVQVYLNSKPLDPNTSISDLDSKSLNMIQPNTSISDLDSKSLNMIQRLWIKHFFVYHWARMLETKKKKTGKLKC